ncbi:KOW motif-containing protein [Luteolibacter sp. GHJ8]|uniref:KOW motif-containing protein n=1 Tax=Luteolibacter rhizosphaerae TaxID=2989719 RepID=A0ABT3G0C1_9BACT|nr:KOW motif-containing protein [Luteolibacter rhizosphaerae]MCW1912929.1 KOW motif-containing protein [Luteolibacter rhizosphaerae]
MQKDLHTGDRVRVISGDSEGFQGVIVTVVRTPGHSRYLVAKDDVSVWAERSEIALTEEFGGDVPPLS